MMGGWREEVFCEEAGLVENPGKGVVCGRGNKCVERGNAGVAVGLGSMQCGCERTEYEKALLRGS
jgi:hypothetical protein